ARDDLVEDGHCPGGVRALDDSFQEARRRLIRRARLKDDGSDVTASPVECLVERGEVVEPEAVSELPDRLGYAGRAWRRPDVPVVPTVIAAREDVVATRAGAGQADCCARCVRSRLPE